MCISRFNTWVCLSVCHTISNQQFCHPKCFPNVSRRVCDCLLHSAHLPLSTAPRKVSSCWLSSLSLSTLTKPNSPLSCRARDCTPPSSSPALACLLWSALPDNIAICWFAQYSLHTGSMLKTSWPAFFAQWRYYWWVASEWIIVVIFCAVSCQPTRKTCRYTHNDA